MKHLDKVLLGVTATVTAVAPAAIVVSCTNKNNVDHKTDTIYNPVEDEIDSFGTFTAKEWALTTEPTDKVSYKINTAPLGAVYTCNKKDISTLPFSELKPYTKSDNRLAVPSIGPDGLYMGTTNRCNDARVIWQEIDFSCSVPGNAIETYCLNIDFNFKFGGNLNWIYGGFAYYNGYAVFDIDDNEYPNQICIAGNEAVDRQPLNCLYSQNYDDSFVDLTEPRDYSKKESTQVLLNFINPEPTTQEIHKKLGFAMMVDGFPGIVGDTYCNLTSKFTIYNALNEDTIKQIDEVCNQLNKYFADNRERLEEPYFQKVFAKFCRKNFETEKAEFIKLLADIYASKTFEYVSKTFPDSSRIVSDADYYKWRFKQFSHQFAKNFNKFVNVPFGWEIVKLVETNEFKAKYLDAFYNNSVKNIAVSNFNKPKDPTNEEDEVLPDFYAYYDNIPGNVTLPSYDADNLNATSTVCNTKMDDENKVLITSSTDSNDTRITFINFNMYVKTLDYTNTIANLIPNFMLELEGWQSKTGKSCVDYSVELFYFGDYKDAESAKAKPNRLIVDSNADKEKWLSNKDKHSFYFQTFSQNKSKDHETQTLTFDSNTFQDLTPIAIYDSIGEDNHEHIFSFGVALVAYGDKELKSSKYSIKFTPSFIDQTNLIETDVNEFRTYQKYEGDANYAKLDVSKMKKGPQGAILAPQSTPTSIYVGTNARDNDTRAIYMPLKTKVTIPAHTSAKYAIEYEVGKNLDSQVIANANKLHQRDVMATYDLTTGTTIHEGTKVPNFIAGPGYKPVTYHKESDDKREYIDPYLNEGLIGYTLYQMKYHCTGKHLLPANKGYGLALFLDIFNWVMIAVDIALIIYTIVTIVEFVQTMITILNVLPSADASITFWGLLTESGIGAFAERQTQRQFINSINKLTPMFWSGVDGQTAKWAVDLGFMRVEFNEFGFFQYLVNGITRYKINQLIMTAVMACAITGVALLAKADFASKVVKINKNIAEGYTVSNVGRIEYTLTNTSDEPKTYEIENGFSYLHAGQNSKYNNNSVAIIVSPSATLTEIVRI